MSHQFINAALAVHLQLMGQPTEYENAQFSPVDGVTYLSENYLPAQTTPVGLAFGDTEDFSGIYQINVHAVRDALKGEGMETARAVAQHFKRGTTLSTADVRVLIERVDQAAAIEDGNRWVIPVSARFRAFVKETA